jgi:hypothetical protein
MISHSSSLFTTVSWLVKYLLHWPPFINNLQPTNLAAFPDQAVGLPRCKNHSRQQAGCGSCQSRRATVASPSCRPSSQPAQDGSCPNSGGRDLPQAGVLDARRVRHKKLLAKLLLTIKLTNRTNLSKT